MREYHKINSIFKRDEKTKKFLDQYSCPEFEYLANNEWEFTEKVDGTNVRIHWDGANVKFGGRTDNAQMPVSLMEHLNGHFTPQRLSDVFSDITPDTNPVTLYGEGYGAKIQKGGGDYRPDQGFILFDILVGKWWLKREDIEFMAGHLGVPITPIIGRGTLADAIDLCEKGFQSRLRDSEPEGLVIRPSVELKARSGNRIITKLKLRDFKP